MRKLEPTGKWKERERQSSNTRVFTQSFEADFSTVFKWIHADNVNMLRKSVIQKCAHLPALEPLLDSPPNILKCPKLFLFRCQLGSFPAASRPRQVCGAAVRQGLAQRHGGAQGLRAVRKPPETSGGPSGTRLQAPSSLEKVSWTSISTPG